MSDGEQGVVQIRREGTTAGRGLLDRLRVLALRHPRAWFFAGILALYLATATYIGSHIDVAAAMRPAWVLARIGTLNLDGVPHEHLPWYFEHDGGIYSDRFPGAILYLVPSYWIADKLGFHDFTFIPGTVTAAVVSAAAVMVLHAVYGKILPTAREVWVATVFTALGTGVWSLAAHAPWSHTLNLLLISLALLALSRGSWWMAGIWFGFAIATRPTVAVGALVAGVVLAVANRSILPMVRIGVGCLPGVALLFAYNGLLFGRWGPSNGHELGGDVHVRLADLPGNLLGAFISPERGLLFYYPILVIVAVGAVSAWCAAAAWERAAASAGVVVLLTQLALNRYSGGDTFFGPRLVIEPLALAAPLIARSVWEFSRQHGVRFVRWAVVAGIVIHGVGGITVHLVHGF